MTMSAYVRQAALGRPAVLTLDPTSLELVREIVTRVVNDNVGGAHGADQQLVELRRAHPVVHDLVHRGRS
ncbi:MAG TPA: hypothetical protein VGD67_25885 [Pseudonocardiaceae bacterium]